MSTFTLVHVAISLVGILTGLIAILGLVRAVWLAWWQWVFLITTIATSVTGFFFPFKGVTPGIILGIVSLVVLAVALLALRKAWTKTYIATACLAEFLNVLVLIVQSFQKIPSLHAIAPKGNEPIIAICQAVAFLFFAVLAAAAMRKPPFVVA